MQATTSINRTRMLAIGREESRRMSRRINRIVPISDVLKKYKEEAEPLLDKMQPSNFGDFISDASTARVLYVDDWHTHRPPKLFFKKLLRDLTLRGRKLVLAVELFPASSQAVMDSYSRREIDDEMLHMLIMTRGFCSETQCAAYAELFKFARALGIPIVSIDSQCNGGKEQDIEVRDRKIAKAIKRASTKFPDSLICVSIGGWHLGASHVPSKVAELFSESDKPKQVVLFQNFEQAYGALVKKGMEQNVDIVRLDEDVYCIMTSTPLAQRLSQYQYLLEMDEYGTPVMSVVANTYLSVLSQFLHANPKVRVSSAAIYVEDELSYFVRGANGSIPQIILSEAGYGRPIISPQGPSLFLPTGCAEEVVSTLGAYVHFRMLQNGFRSFAVGETELFYDEVLQHAFGQVISRLVDHHGRAAVLEEMRMVLRYKNSVHYPFEIKCARILDAYLKSEDDFLRSGMLPDRFSALSGASRRELVRRVGALLGDKLFAALMSDTLSPEQLRELLGYNPRSTKTQELYLELRRRF